MAVTDPTPSAPDPVSSGSSTTDGPATESPATESPGEQGNGTATKSVPPTWSPSAPLGPLATRAWWHPHLEPEERRRVMSELGITRVEGWAWRFTVMLTLSVIVAVMGLSANSAAVVIGAMLLAPLMTPVLATAACLSMSLIRKSYRSLLKVVLATSWCIAVAFVLSMLIPDGPLAGEVEARTRPDVRDLVVALAAGAAGSYATVRKDASAALPGVAVAVALVPPLATVGITLEANEIDLAIGAALLYSTNLAAIVFAGVVVFIATGFVPPKRLANTAVQLLAAAVIAFVVLATLAVPLFNRSVEAVEAAADEVKARAIVADWLNGAALQEDVDVEADRVLVELRGFDRPPDDAALTAALQDEFGPVNVVVEWIRTERATTTTTVVLSDDEVLLQAISPIVDAWLRDHDELDDYERERLRLVDGVLRIDVAGVGDPPPVDDLTSRIADETGVELAVRLNWTAQEAFVPEGEPTPNQVMERNVELRVADWALDNDVEVELIDYDASAVTIEVAGSAEPPIDGLIDDLHALIGSPVPVQVLFTQQQVLTTTTTVASTTIPADSGPPGASPETTTG